MKNIVKVDANWYPGPRETFRLYKKKLLHLILHESDIGINLREIIISMYEGSGLWSVRHSMYRNGKYLEEMEPNIGLFEVLRLIYVWASKLSKYESKENLSLDY